MNVWSSSIPDENRKREAEQKRYREFLRIPPMSAGLYVLAAGAEDPQKPHAQDELYYVVRGHARFRAEEEDSEVAPGSLLFVAANVAHKFYDIKDELAVLVVFAPAETS